MKHRMSRNRSAISLMLVAFLAVGGVRLHAQATRSPAQGRDQDTERIRLIKQAQELRRSGKFVDAVAVAEQILALERRAAGDTTAGVAEALSRVAELDELVGNWGRALARRKAALEVRERLGGKHHWRTTDARIALAFAEKVTGLSPSDRKQVQGALQNEELMAARMAQQKFAESERLGLEALDTYRKLLGPGAAEAGRAWVRIGRSRMERGDASGAMEAYERALTIRSQTLPAGHPLIAESLVNLGEAQAALQNPAAAKKNFEEALTVFRNEKRTCITTAAVSRCADQEHLHNPFVAKWFGSPSSAPARRIYLPPGRTLEHGSDSAPGPVAFAAAVIS